MCRGYRSHGRRATPSPSRASWRRTWRRRGLIEEDDPTKFYPGHTRRVSALVARSPSITDRLVPHPLSRQICDTHLLPNCEHGYQLHVTAAVEIGPGAREQVLHREERFVHVLSLAAPQHHRGQHVGRYGVPRGQRRHSTGAGQPQMACRQKAQTRRDSERADARRRGAVLDGRHAARCGGEHLAGLALRSDPDLFPGLGAAGREPVPGRASGTHGGSCRPKSGGFSGSTCTPHWDSTTRRCRDRKRPRGRPIAQQSDDACRASRRYGASAHTSRDIVPIPVMRAAGL